MRNVRLAAVLVCCVFALGLGCKKGATPEKGAEAVKAVKVPTEPDKFLQVGLDALKNNKPVEAYALLPDSYRKDIQGIVTAVTSNLDKEVFELGVKVLDKAMVCLDKHGDKLAAMVPAGGPVDVKAAMGEVKKFYALLKDTGLTNYDSVKALDVAGFLAAHGEKIMKSSMDAGKALQGEQMAAFEKTLAGVTIKTKEVKDDAATVEITAEGKTEAVKLTKVDGRWVPTDMAEGWAKEVKGAREQVEAGMKAFAGQKDQVKAMLTQVLEGLNKFEESGDPAALMAMGAMMNM